MSSLLHRVLVVSSRRVSFAASASSNSFSSSISLSIIRRSYGFLPSSPPLLPRSSCFSSSFNRGKVSRRGLSYLRQTTHSIRRFGRNYLDFNGNPQYAVYSIIIANTAVFFAWKASQSDFRLSKFMSKNFMISSHGVLAQHRYHTMLTSFFSHSGGQHLFFNMFSLFFFGVEAATSLGLSRFCMLYFGGGLLSSTAFVLWPYVSGYFGMFGRNFRSRWISII